MLKSSNILNILQLHLYLLIWSEAAETLTHQLTDLGQNVTINCDFDVEEVHWLLLKLPDPPVLILRTFSSGLFYYSDRFKNKYSVQSTPHLFINNITIDDLGLYYCVAKDIPPKYSNGTRLNIIEPTAEIRNCTLVESIKQNHTHWLIVIIIYSLLIIVLIVVIIGLLKVFVPGRKIIRDIHSQNTNLQQLQNMDIQQSQNQVQYSAVDVSIPCQRFQPRQVNSTYALLELPKARTPND